VRHPTHPSKRRNPPSLRREEPAQAAEALRRHRVPGPKATTLVQNEPGSYWNAGSTTLAAVPALKSLSNHPDRPWAALRIGLPVAGKLW
jgi:hypothetical protein